VVGSSVVDDKRLYHINNAMVTREKFCSALMERLGFSKHSFCWNISQHAVQDIVSTLCLATHNARSLGASRRMSPSLCMHVDHCQSSCSLSNSDLRVQHQ
jgi:hypothetical protein